jgi:hypothetical protein
MKITYCGYGTTPEEACKDLERQLQLDANSGAFVTISEASLVRMLSPRLLNRYAIANILDGKDYHVKFARASMGRIEAKIQLLTTAPINYCAETDEDMIMSPRRMIN